MGKKIKIWYDKEGDYLEVLFEREAGYFREKRNDHRNSFIMLENVPDK